MILRRFMKHVTDQNWFAVGLDVIVVIVGIYLGLQVTEWANEKEDRVQERIYIERLKTEVENIQSSLNEVKIGYDYYYTKINELADELTNNNDGIILNEAHCKGAELSHIYSYVTTQLPTVTELISSGQLSILTSHELRSALSEYMISVEKDDMINAGFNNDRLDLARKYPELLALSYKNSAGALHEFNSISCDFDAMQENGGFKNDLLSNFRRAYFFLQNQYVKIPLLENIHSQLETELGINSED